MLGLQGRLDRYLEVTLMEDTHHGRHRRSPELEIGGGQHNIGKKDLLVPEPPPPAAAFHATAGSITAPS